ncbi:hypothetical protein AAY473_025377 [Plecturocebus cupreus]
MESCSFNQARVQWRDADLLKPSPPRFKSRFPPHESGWTYRQGRPTVPSLTKANSTLTRQKLQENTLQ